MNFKEAINLIHFTSVKGVTRLSWERGKYLFQEKGRSWLSITLDEPNCISLPYSATIRDILANDWELYEEKTKLHTFDKAIIALKNGKTIKRHNLSFNYSIGSSYNPSFKIHDVLANDWEILP